jgi:glycosyltransferase involved in cell wall biosynthesis
MYDPPRIAVASSGLGHVARGIEAWAHDLGEALVARGQRVIVCQGGGVPAAGHRRLVPCHTRESAAAARWLRLVPRSLAWRVGMGSGYGVEQSTFAWGLLRLLRRERIDILHVQDPQVALLMQRARTLGLVRTRTILAHGTEESPQFLRRIDYLQHLAPWHLEEARAAGVWKPAWTAIPNFVDTEQFRPAAPGQPSPLRQELQIPADALVVLTVAAIKRGHKRIDHLLGELACLRQSHPQLPVWAVIAGGWETETDALIAEGQRLLGERVRFLVRFPRSRIAELYRAADLFVLTSLKEMMPIALLEALASGLPCLVHEHPVMTWMTGPGGMPTDMQVPGELAGRLAALAKDPAQRLALGQAAREQCVAQFGVDAVVNQILHYYGQVLHAGRRKPALAG